MAFNDSLSDMLARIKNAHQANKVSTLCLKSKLNINVFYDEKTLLWIKMSYEKLGFWEYRLKKVEYF